MKNILIAFLRVISALNDVVWACLMINIVCSVKGHDWDTFRWTMNGETNNGRCCNRCGVNEFYVKDKDNE